MSRWPTGKRVAENIRAVRRHRNQDLKDVAAGLESIGWPINVNGLSRIENGTRRVDVDDLVALALVLNVTPDRLLLPAVADGTTTELIPTINHQTKSLWQWALGQKRLMEIPGESMQDWQNLVRPDRFSIPTHAVQIPNIRKHKEIMDKAVELFSEARDANVDINGLVTYFELVAPIEESSDG